jgi:hypothetical protein
MSPYNTRSKKKTPTLSLSPLSKQIENEKRDMAIYEGNIKKVDYIVELWKRDFLRFVKEIMIHMNKDNIEIGVDFTPSVLQFVKAPPIKETGEKNSITDGKMIGLGNLVIRPTVSPSGVRLNTRLNKELSDEFSLLSARLRTIFKIAKRYLTDTWLTILYKELFQDVNDSIEEFPNAVRTILKSTKPTEAIEVYVEQPNTPQLVQLGKAIMMNERRIGTMYKFDEDEDEDEDEFHDAVNGDRELDAAFAEALELANE